MKRTCLIIFMITMGFVQMFAQQRVLKGTVVSADAKEPLIGASVYISANDLKKAGVNSSLKGTTTDIDGKFAITVPDGVKHIYCSYIGYETIEVTLGSKNNIVIELKSNSGMLDAVVVTGYQNIEKRKLTAAVSQLKLSDEKLGPTMSVDHVLSGKIAGLQALNTSGTPGAPMKIRIRGTASLNGTQDPLWVLDGIPLEGTDIPKLENMNDINSIRQSSIAGINPADIDNINVLKDAAATAIYGARAANGVIVITTKKGKQGKAVINFSSKLTYSPRPSIDKLNLMNSDEKVGLELDLLKTNYVFNENKGEVSRIIQGANLLDKYKANGWNALTPEVQERINALRGINTNWNDIVFRDVFNQEYNINISGGTDKATYYNSVGYFKEDGNVHGVSAERLNLVSKINYKLNDVVSIANSVFINRRKSSSFVSDTYGYTNPLIYTRNANPYFKPYDDKGNYNYDYDIQAEERKDLKFNIFEERSNTKDERITNSLTNIFDLKLRFNDRFRASSQLGLQLDNESIEQEAYGETFTMRNIRLNSRYYDPSTKTYKFIIPEGGFHKENENKNRQVTWKSMLEYKQKLGDNHELEAMVGSEFRKTWYQTLYSIGYGFDPKTLTTKPLLFPDNEKGEKYLLHKKTYVENAYTSLFSTLSYSLFNRYTLGGSVRFDGSNLFGVDKRFQYVPLYSVSGVWRIINEPFMESAGWIDNLALRASYGVQGNIDKNTSPFLIGRYKNVSILPGGSEHMIEVSNAPNKKLRWEKTYSTNVGLDFSMLNQAVNMSIDYYYRKGVDLIGIQMLPLESGFTSSTINWASMINKGVEFSLSTRNVTTRNFSWYTNFNIAYNYNKVLKEAIPGNQTTPSREGYPVGAIFAYKTAGLDKDGYILFKNPKGETVTLKQLYRLVDPEWGFPMATSDVTPEEERSFYQYIGSSEPPVTGGFTNTFNYKNWSLSVNCIFNINGYVKTKPPYEIVDYDRGKNTNRDILSRWTPANTASNLPALIAQDKRTDEYYWYFTNNQIYRNLDIWVKKQSYLRVNDIALSYALPETATKFLHVQKLNIGLQGRNLFVLSTDFRNYLSPETMGNIYAAPIPKSLTFNMNITF
ncbi:SusC/RagA family TonB-linked outer membrane protein [Porphyromonas pogonae]|uniref:SusC/RagA family TonB-linked outer membrane protein n=1 Tax=Porphyromonas pogonae TaxID=867595 RepID=UPI002E78D821|nr:SusC/RagA family TonB-linked outer membrane protein [Porphyromonas pogonae]